MPPASDPSASPYVNVRERMEFQVLKGLKVAGSLCTTIVKIIAE